MSVGDAAEELDPEAAVERFEPLAVGPVADDLDRQAGDPRRLERDLDPLVGDDLADEEEEVLRLADGKALDRDGRVDDLRLDPVELAGSAPG